MAKKPTRGRPKGVKDSVPRVRRSEGWDEQKGNRNYKLFCFRVYDPLQWVKLQEFRKTLEMSERAKPFPERTTFNQTMVNVMVAYTENRFLENSAKIINDLLMPLIKKTFKNQLDDLTELLLFKSNQVIENTNQINSSLKDMELLQIFLNNLVSVKFGEGNQLINELNNPNSTWFKRPGWVLDKSKKED